MELRKRFSTMTIESAAGWLGLAVALFLGAFRVFNQLFDDRMPFNPLRFREEALGNIVSILILATPYVIALFSQRLAPGTRWLVLLPATLVSLPALFISFSLIGFLFIPAIVLLFMATARSLNNNSVSGIGKALGALMTMVIVVTVSSAGMSLFRHGDDARGWRYTTFGDGRTVWESVPQIPGRLGISGQAPQGGTSAGAAVSDIITASEAALAGGLLLLAWLELGSLGLYASRRWPIKAAVPM